MRQTLLGLGVLACFLLLGGIWFIMIRGGESFHTPTPNTHTTDISVISTSTDEFPNSYHTEWNNIPITVAALPRDPFVRVSTNTPDTFELIMQLAAFYPPSGGTLMHPITISIHIEKNKTKPGAQTANIQCVKPQYDEASNDLTYTSGTYTITIHAFAATKYSGPYSAPNPYTPEVLYMFENVINSITIGKC